MGRWRATQSGKVGGLPADAYTVRMRGSLHVYQDAKRGFIARSWPKSNGGDTPARKIARELFSSVIKGVSNPDALSKLEALRVAKNTPFTWRDVMMSAAFGNLYIQVDSDGNYWIGWRLAFATIQVLLDSILNRNGTMLVRAPEGWVALLPGDDGQVLTFDLAAGIPQWKFFTADVQATLDQLAPSLGDVAKYDGTNWQAVDISALYDASGAASAALVSANAFTAAAVAAIVLPTGANPSATASDAAVNGTSAHFMRADAAPAVQKASDVAFGLVRPDTTTIKQVGGVLSTASGGAGGYVAGAPPTVVQFGKAVSGGNSVTLGAAPTSGNLLVALCFNPTSQTIGAGWSLVANNVSGTDFGVIVQKVAGASESATQSPLSGVSTTGAIAMWEVHGQNATAPFAFAATQAEQTTSSSSLPVEAPNDKDMLALSAVAVATSNNIVAGLNVGTQDALDNSASRKLLAGHSDLSKSPTAGLACIVNATTFSSKSATALIRA